MLPLPPPPSTPMLLSPPSPTPSPRRAYCRSLSAAGDAAPRPKGPAAAAAPCRSLLLLLVMMPLLLLLLLLAAALAAAAPGPVARPPASSTATKRETRHMGYRARGVIAERKPWVAGSSSLGCEGHARCEQEARQVGDDAVCLHSCLRGGHCRAQQRDCRARGCNGGRLVCCCECRLPHNHEQPSRAAAGPNPAQAAAPLCPTPPSDDARLGPTFRLLGT